MVNAQNRRRLSNFDQSLDPRTQFVYGSLCAHSVDHLWVICGFDGKDPSVPATFHFSAAVMARPSDLERLPTLDSKVVRETVALYTSRLRKGTLLRWRCGSATHPVHTALILDGRLLALVCPGSEHREGQRLSEVRQVRFLATVKIVDAANSCTATRSFRSPTTPSQARAAMFQSSSPLASIRASSPSTFIKRARS